MGAGGVVVSLSAEHPCAPLPFPCCSTDRDGWAEVQHLPDIPACIAPTHTVFTPVSLLSPYPPLTSRDGWAEVQHLPDIPASSAALCAMLISDGLPYYPGDAALTIVQSALAAYYASGGGAGGGEQVRSQCSQRRVGRWVRWGDGALGEMGRWVRWGVW